MKLCIGRLLETSLSSKVGKLASGGAAAPLTAEHAAKQKKKPGPLARQGVHCRTGSHRKLAAGDVSPTAHPAAHSS